MLQDTLKKPRATSDFEIRPIEDLNSPNYPLYMRVLDDIWRGNEYEDGTEILAASGVVGYVAIDRSSVAAIKYAWFRHTGDTKVISLSHAEELLAGAYGSRIWKTHLKGQRHSYYFYSRFDTIEEFLSLVEVARVMIS